MENRWSDWKGSAAGPVVGGRTIVGGGGTRADAWRKNRWTVATRIPLSALVKHTG